MPDVKYMPGLSSQIRAVMSGHVFHTATLWLIEAVNPGTPKLRFTDHNEEIIYDGNPFEPSGGFDASSRESSEGLKDQTVSTKGIITSDKITEEDLRAGRYREAKITEILVDWRWPWAGAISTQTYYVRDISWDTDLWRAEVTSITSQMRNLIGRTYELTCTWWLGEGQCGNNGMGVDLTAGTFSGSGEITVIDRQRKIFESDLSHVDYVDQWWKYGLLTWTGGDNNGFKFEVRESEETDGKIWLHIKTPFDFQVGDTFDIHVGCDHTAPVCLEKFNNRINFGGFAEMPLVDEATETPDVIRSGED